MYRGLGARQSGLKAAGLFVVLTLACVASAPAQQLSKSAAGSKPPDGQHLATTLAHLPIRFEPTDTKGTFLARGIGAGVRLTGRSIDFPRASNDGDSIRVQFVGARKSSRVVGVDALPGRINYLYGDDPAKWRTSVRTYGRAHTSELYRGVDVDYYGVGDRLEYDLVVRPGARPDSIRLSISGASISITKDGDLAYGDRVLLRKPMAYQAINGDRRDVSVDYQRRADGSFGFVVGAYDRSQLLVIDPIVQYSFTFGGSGYEIISDIVADNVGAVYVGGTTSSSDFPTVNPAEARQDAGFVRCYRGEAPDACSDGFLAKLQPDGAALEYATYFGVSGWDTVYHVAVDGNHALYFAGLSETPYPGLVIKSSFIGKLSPDGSRFLYRIVGLGRSIDDLAVGPDGSAYVVSHIGEYGTSSEVATLSPTGDNFRPILTISDPPGIRQTFLTAIAMRGSALYVAGYTSWSGFPTTNGAAQTQFGGLRDGIVMRLQTDSTVVYSTFVGGAGDDTIADLALDSNGDVYTAGDTGSNSPCQPWSPSRPLITKLSNDGSSISYSTPLSYPLAACNGVPMRIAVDNDANAHVAGCGSEHNSQTGTTRTQCDFWKLGPTGSVLRSESDVPSSVFTIDPTGTTRWFGSTTANSRRDAWILKFVSLQFISLTNDVSVPVRFATTITWTAAVFATDPVEYTFWRYGVSDGWVEAQAYGPNASYTWTPASWDVGDHYLCAIARLVASPGITEYSCVQFTISGLSPGEPPILAPAADFTQDHRPDLIWQNAATGELAWWNVGGGAHGEQLIAGGYLNSPKLPAGWHVAGSGDVDGDGSTDLFLQSDSGQLAVWLFDGLNFRVGMVLTPGQLPDPDWKIRAVADINVDGHPDLVWQHAPTGKLSFWLLNGTQLVESVIPDIVAPGGEWEIVGAGDSNRDGAIDLLWQHRTTGTLAVWWMDGTSLLGGLLFSASRNDARWRVVAASDLDGDGYTDLIFQNSDTGQIAAWYLAGSTMRFGAMLIPSSAGMPEWRIVGPR